MTTLTGTSLTAPAPAVSGKLTAQQSRTLVGQLRRSEMFRDYEQAFREPTPSTCRTMAIPTRRRFAP